MGTHNIQCHDKIRKVPDIDLRRMLTGYLIVLYIFSELCDILILPCSLYRVLLGRAHIFCSYRCSAKADYGR